MLEKFKKVQGRLPAQGWQGGSPGTSSQDQTKAKGILGEQAQGREKRQKIRGATRAYQASPRQDHDAARQHGESGKGAKGK